MILIVGPLFSGKRKFAQEYLDCREEEMICDVQEMVSAGMTEKALLALADRLEEKRVVIATEIGCGIVPIDKEERICRELAGRLQCLLAERAETVIRIFCGIPMVLKGSLE